MLSICFSERPRFGIPRKRPFASGFTYMGFSPGALRSQASIAAWKRAHPRGRLIVVLTGTDIYGAGAADVRTQASLKHAWRIVALQADAAARVPADLQAKTRVILQSAVLPP